MTFDIAQFTPTTSAQASQSSVEINSKSLQQCTPANMGPFLQWSTKEPVLSLVGTGSLKLQNEFSVGDLHAANMLIEGDNLEAMRALRSDYNSKIKCVFLDPPYNTASDFDHYDDNMGHAHWLSMMYPRLQAVRDLMADDGSLFISVDDNESHYLKVILDEIFGRANFVSNIIWQKKYTVANDAKHFSTTHDHILVYAKDKNKWRPNRLKRSAEMDARYKNPDDHPKGPWKATPLHAKSGSKGKSGAAFTYRFKNGICWSPPIGTYSRFSEASLAAMDDADEIWFGKNGKGQPCRKTFLTDIAERGSVTSTIWLHDEVGNNHESRNEARNFVPDDPFKTPKPERLIERILMLATKPGDLVLDSFLGSGTTIAVAHKMNRRWIGIELGAHARTHVYPRMKAVVEGEQSGISASASWPVTGGSGFRYFKMEK